MSDERIPACLHAGDDPATPALEVFPETMLAHGGIASDGAVVPPVYSATTFARDRNYQPRGEGRLYSRSGSAAFEAPEHTLALLEQGAAAMVYASGMAAIADVFHVLPAGSCVVLPDAMYWGVYSWSERYCERNGIRIIRYRMGAEDPVQSLRDALSEAVSVQLVWLETPSNPLMHVIDIEAAAALGHEHGAVVCVDSTAATPVHTRPLQLGADLVVHSATKYLNGHSDVLAGALITREADAFWDMLKSERAEAGPVLGGFECWLLSRGMRTLYPRVRAASASAQRVAQFLEEHARVTRVRYPGLPGCHGHAIAQRQMQGGFGGLLSFEVEGGESGALAVANALRIITPATSLGGLETLVEHRYSIEPAITGIPPGLLRLAVGIEHCDDLIEDLQQALAQTG